MFNVNLQKIKIAQVITRLDRGGAPKIFLSIVKKLDLERYDITLISGLTRNPVSEIEEIKKRGIKYICFPFLRREINLIFDIIAFFWLYFIFRKEHFDLVHTHTSKAGALGRLAAKLAGVPVVIHTTHGHVFYGYFGPIMNRILILIEKFLSYFCDKITTLTEQEKLDLIRYGVAKENKLEVIYDGIDLDRFSNVNMDIDKKKNELNLPLGSPVIGFIGRLEPIKGPFYFVEVAKLICDYRQDVMFLIVGDGSLRKKLEARTKELNIVDKVIFSGFREDVPEILKAIDVVVLTSLNEGLGISLLEAQASAKPVVATKVGGIPEVVLDGKTGILVKPCDPKGLAKAINTLLEDKAKAFQMAQSGRAWVESRFNINSELNKYFNLYNSLYLKRCLR